MGNIDAQDTIVMAWEGGRLDGVEVACTVTSMAASIAAEAFTRRVLAGKPIRGRDIEALAAVFVDHVQRWTLRTGQGRPVRVRVRDFLALHKSTVFDVLKEWVKHVNAPPPAPAPEVEQPELVEPVEVDPGLLLEARSLQEPGPDEVLVGQPAVPELVDA